MTEKQLDFSKWSLKKDKYDDLTVESASEDELVDIINELNDENKRLKLENSGLKYALKYIKKIDVKIDVDDFND